MKKVPVYNLQTISCKPSKIGNLEILTFEKHLKNIEDVHFPHRHDFYYMLYISKGGGSHTIDFRTYPVKGGQLFFMSPGQIHEWDIKPGTTGFTLFFNRELFYEDGIKIEEQWPYFHSIFNKPAYSISGNHKTEVEKWFKLIFNEYIQTSDSNGSVVKYLLYSFLFKLNSVLKIQGHNNEGRKSDILRKYELLIDEYFVEQQRVSFYVSKLNISPNYLNALCVKFLNRPAKTLINERVLLEAQRLLHHSNLGVEEISDHLHFKSASYFIRFFKKATNQTPLQFKTK